MRFSVLLTDHKYNGLLQPGQIKVRVKDRHRLISVTIVTSVGDAMRAAESEILEYLAIERQNETDMPWPVEQ